MEKRTIYCSACDREVAVVLRDGNESYGPHPDLEGAGCSELGARCTGTACPVCAVPLVQIAAAR